MIQRYLFRILLVDDDALDASFVDRAFQDYRDNVLVRHVEGIDEAIAELSGNPFDIVILDINLNGQSGLDAIADLRARSKTTLLPVIVFTSSTSVDDVKKAFENGANAYVEKPLSIHGYRQFAAKFLGFWAELALIPAR
ncbi:MAG: hypothetical protein RIR97_1017 [Pseudomonadota bacterium]|jgi:DNA-binding response OmpR family regulator